MSLALLCRDESEIEEVNQVVQQLVSARLLVTSYDMQSKQDMVEIIHDALLWEWRQLKQWREEDRSLCAWHQELERRVRAWVETNPDDPGRRDEYKLFGGPDLKEAIQWLIDRSSDLSQVERDFIQDSQKRQEQEEQLRKLYEKQQAVIRLRRRRFLVGLAGLGLAVAGSGSAYLVWRSQLPQYTIITTIIYRGHSKPVWSVVWSHDGTRIASAGVDETVQVWDANTGSPFYTYKGHRGGVSSVTWSPDDYSIASASYDNTVQVWNSDGTYLVGLSKPIPYRNHTDLVLAVASSPDSKHIASGRYDNTVQVWDAQNGSLVVTYRKHTKQLESVAWSPRGARIASAGDDKTAQVWQIE